jgi:hypothetical protein
MRIVIKGELERRQKYYFGSSKVDHSEYLAAPGMSRLAHSGACWDYFEVTVAGPPQKKTVFQILVDELSLLLVIEVIYIRSYAAR